MYLCNVKEHQQKKGAARGGLFDRSKHLAISITDRKYKKIMFNQLNYKVMSTKNTNANGVQSFDFSVNSTNRLAKEQNKEYFANYEKHLISEFEGLKNEDAEAIKMICRQLCGLSAKSGVKVPVFIVRNFSKFISSEFEPLTKYIAKSNGQKVIYYKPKRLDGRSANTILRNAINNYIESLRTGNRFAQAIIDANSSLIVRK